jgi:hypothetical protein
MWHAFYYILSPRALKTYALTCKETVTEINTNKAHTFQVKLHLSLCQACTNYENYSKWLKLNFPEKKLGAKVDLSKKIFDKIKNHDNTD